jgi:hypothetical protein
MFFLPSVPQGFRGFEAVSEEMAEQCRSQWDTFDYLKKAVRIFITRAKDSIRCIFEDLLGIIERKRLQFRKQWFRPCKARRPFGTSHSDEDGNILKRIEVSKKLVH